MMGSPKSALCILKSLRTKNHYAEFQKAIIENIGLAYSIDGDHRRAALAFGSVAKMDANRINAASSWLLNAMQFGDHAFALEAAAVLDEVPTPLHDALLDVINMLRATKTAGKWATRPEALATIRIIEQDLGPLSEKVANVLY